jgi:hypothetical protein
LDGWGRADFRLGRPGIASLGTHRGKNREQG